MMTIKKPFYALLILCSLYFIVSCDSKLKGFRGCSESIEFSKEKGLYIGSYKIQGDNIINTGNGSYDITNCYLEKRWNCGAKLGEVEFSDRFKEDSVQLVINVDGELLKDGYLLKWELAGNDFYLGYRGRGAFCGFLDEIHNYDTLSCHLVVGNDLLSKSERRDTIREFVFIKQW